MSLDALRENTRRRLVEKIDTSLRLVANQIFRPAFETKAGTALPAQTLEEIAVFTLTLNAAAKAFQDALDVLDEEYKKIIDPAGAPVEDEQAQGESIY